MARAAAGLSAQDEILAIDGTRVTPRTLAGTLAGRKRGDRIKVLFSRRGGVREAELVLGIRAQASFKISPLAAPTARQKALFDAWLK